MNEWVEERAEALRLALRIPGFPEEGDLYRLVEWLDGCILLRRGEVPRAMCVHREDHRAVITLPAEAEGREVGWLLAEEIGHYLLTRGMAALLRQSAPHDLGARRLAQRWEWRDEALARAFLQAWHLPSHLVQAIEDDGELAWQGRCSLEFVRERRRDLEGRVIRLEVPPRWSAARHYRLEHLRVGAGHRLLVGEHGRPVAAFALDQAAEVVRETAFQVTADLTALTFEEFGVKYAPFRCTGPEAVDLDLTQLRRWAGVGETEANDAP